MPCARASTSSVPARPTFHLVLDEHTEFRGNLSLNTRRARGFDVIQKRVREAPLELRSVAALRSYIHSTSRADSAVTSPGAAEDASEELELRHFRCQSDAERDAWLRALRQARFPRFPFSR